jgi:hypothetical protein
MFALAGDADLAGSCLRVPPENCTALGITMHDARHHALCTMHCTRRSPSALALQCAFAHRVGLVLASDIFCDPCGTLECCIPDCTSGSSLTLTRHYSRIQAYTHTYTHVHTRTHIARSSTQRSVSVKVARLILAKAHATPSPYATNAPSSYSETSATDSSTLASTRRGRTAPWSGWECSFRADQRALGSMIQCCPAECQRIFHLP